MTQARINQPVQAFRPATARLVARLVAPLLDSGLVTNREYDQLVTTMKSLTHSDAMTVPTKLITGQSAAEMLGISYSQFRALESEGSFPFQRRLVGSKTVRYRLADLIRYINAEDCESSDRSKKATAFNDFTQPQPNGD